MAKLVTKKHIQGAVLRIESGDSSLSLSSQVGNMQEDDYYFIASVTKLYISSILLKLRADGKLQLSDKIKKYLPEDIMEKLHIIDGVNYSNEITIKHLMSNTSGIPDYFSSQAMQELIQGNDRIRTFDEVIAFAKQKQPRFKPGQKGKAQYCDTNYRLLGRIIEIITGKSIQMVMQEYIFQKLALKHTYVFSDVLDKRPKPLNYKSKEVELPLHLSTNTSEGGIVSNTQDQVTFLKAFFEGRFFPKEDFLELEEWNILFGPGLFFYGVGISRQPLTLFGIKKGLIGHWGQSGAFAFYHPETDLYFTGTINSVTGQSHAAKLIIKLIKAH